MQFSRELRNDVLTGDITLTVRLWARAQVKEGGRYRVGFGEIEVDSVELVPFAAITDADVRRAGERERESLRRRAAHAGPIDEDTLVYRQQLGASKGWRPVMERLDQPSSPPSGHRQRPIHPESMNDTPAALTVPRQAAWRLACAAAALGALYAAVSAYWALGGTALLDTIGGALGREGRAGAIGLLAVVWVTVVVKLAASTVGLAAVAQPQWMNARHHRLLRGAAWVIAAVLVLYGGVLTSVGVLVQAGIVHASAHADHRALRWHAFLWDPWFLIWGLLLAAALRDRRVEPAR